MAFGYEWLEGRKGASGVIRAENGERKISVQGLKAGAEAALYVIDGGRTRKIASAQADDKGQTDFRAPKEGWAFITAEGRLALYQGGDRPEEGYARACAALKKLQAPPCAAPIPEHQAAPSAAAAKNNTQQKEIMPVPEERTKAAYSLRAPSAGEPADDLPSLQWPRGTEDIRGYFDALPPMAPFEDASGWRFVRLPSPLRGVAYCALGRYALDDRVTRLAYALPGMPQRPPVPLPGYRYRPGKGGMGYWIAEQEV